MTDEQKKPSAKPIGHVSEYATLGSKHSNIQKSENRKVEIVSTPDSRKSKHPEWEQQTIYLPPALKKWLKLFAVQADLEISEVVGQALREFREKHK